MLRPLVRRPGLFSRVLTCRNLAISSKSRLLSNDRTKEANNDKSSAPPEGIMRKLPEELISEGNGMKPTRAENQIDTLKCYNTLVDRGFTPVQTELIIDLLLKTLNEGFFSRYNTVFLQNMELENQSHLFHAAETELKYAIQTSRDSQLNDQHLQLMKLIRDLDSMQDEINEMIINLLQKDSRVDFHNQKTENTLLQRKIKLELSDCTNKIATKLLGNARSEIESLRWQTTRSGLLAILILVFFIMGGASFARKVTVQSEENEAKEIEVKEPEVIPEKPIE